MTILLRIQGDASQAQGKLDAVHRGLARLTEASRRVADRAGPMNAALRRMVEAVTALGPPPDAETRAWARRAQRAARRSARNRPSPMSNLRPGAPVASAHRRRRAHGRPRR